MSKTIAVVQVKGGAGRSTLATNIAGELGKIAATVLIDGDMPQGTSASWYALRQQAGKADQLRADTAQDHRELIAKHQQHAAGAEYLVLDGPPRIAAMTRAALMLSDICIVPLGASVAEVWATGDLVAIIEEARQQRTIDVRIVWTRHRAYTTLAKELTEQTSTALKLPAFKSTLGLRVAFAEALGTGLTVAETGDPVARDELHQLMTEIRRILR